MKRKQTSIQNLGDVKFESDCEERMGDTNEAISRRERNTVAVQRNIRKRRYLSLSRLNFVSPFCPDSHLYFSILSG